MNLTIRDYQLTDNALVQSFIEKIQDYVVSTDPIKRIRRLPGLGPKGLKNILEKLEKNHGKIYIAEDDGLPIGYVSGFVCDPQNEETLLEVIPSKLGQIEDLYVEPEHRGKKIGQLLMGKMEKYLKDQGCDSIWIEVFALNTTAHDIYLKSGYVDREIGMLKKV